MSDIVFPSNYTTIDAVLFKLNKVESLTKLEVLLVKRTLDPFKGMFSLPGTFLKPFGTLEETLKSVFEVKLKSKIENYYFEQLNTFSEFNRDETRDKRVITVPYLVLVGEKNIGFEPGFNVGGIEFVDVKEVLTGDKKLAFDHIKIIQHAYKRLKNRIEHFPLVLYLLSNETTISDILNADETILNKSIKHQQTIRKYEKFLIKTDKLKKVEGNRGRKVFEVDFDKVEDCIGETLL